MKSINVKLIDLGSCCESNTPYSCPIQTIHYRSPEIILQYPINSKIDIWSVGCVAAELMFGIPIFICENEDELIYLINLRISNFPKHLIENSTIKLNYFNENNEIFSKSEFFKKNYKFNIKNYFQNDTLIDNVITYPYPLNISLESLKKKKNERTIFLDLLQKMLLIDPNERISAKDALNHPFFQLEN